MLLSQALLLVTNLSPPRVGISIYIPWHKNWVTNGSMTQAGSIKSFNSIFYLEVVRTSPLFLLVANTNNINLELTVTIVYNIQREAKTRETEKASELKVLRLVDLFPSWLQ